jgi:hypothetical protein
VKLREMLIERISLASHTPTISSGVFDHVRGVITNVYKLNKQLMKTTESRRQIHQLFQDALVSSIPELLTGYAKTYAGSSPLIVIDAFEAVGVNGAYIHDTNTLQISKKFIIDLANFYVARINRELNGEDFRTYTPLIRSKTNGIAVVFVHELTHYIQFSKSGKERPRSYIYDKGQVNDFLAKNKLVSKKDRDNNPNWDEDTSLQKINVYIAKDALDIKKNVAIYLGQPEEIAAHAQEFVAGILNQISKLPKDNQLTQIDKVLRSVHEISNYSMMKDQDNPSYKKVLNRYLKSVYQEFDSYRDSLELP